MKQNGYTKQLQLLQAGPCGESKHSYTGRQTVGLGLGRVKHDIPGAYKKQRLNKCVGYALSWLVIAGRWPLFVFNNADKTPG